MEEENSNKEKELQELREKVLKYEERYGKFGDIRNLFIKKPTVNDWITLLLIIAVVVMAFFYMNDIQTCKNYVASNQKTWNSLTNGTGIVQSAESSQTLAGTNYSKIIFNEENKTAIT